MNASDRQARDAGGCAGYEDAREAKLTAKVPLPTTKLGAYRLARQYIKRYKDAADGVNPCQPWRKGFTDQFVKEILEGREKPVTNCKYSEPMVQTAIWLPREMRDWLKSQPESMGETMRKLIKKEMEIK